MCVGGGGASVKGVESGEGERRERKIRELLMLVSPFLT